MIYTAKKNGHTRTFSDADGMAKLLHYRRNGWEISASLGRPEKKEEPHPAPRIKEKADERRGKQYRRILGRWVVVN